MDVKDIGKKIENVELVEAMHAVRENENKDTLKQLFESVVHAVFIVPAKFDQEPKPDENGKVTFQDGVKINFSLLTNEQGDKVLPCFTDYESMASSQFNDGFQRIILPYKQLEDLVFNSNGNISGIAMNPFTVLLHIRRVYPSVQRALTYRTCTEQDQARRNSQAQNTKVSADTDA